MTTMVDPLVAFARKHPEMFAADQRARMTRVLNTPGLEKADVVNQDLVKAEKIARRKDVNPKRGIAEYGKVKFADPVNKKYPLDSEEHVRAAWSYINMPKNAAKYQPGAVALMKRRIMAAAKQYGVAIDAPTAKSANDASLTKANGHDVSREARDASGRWTDSGADDTSNEGTLSSSQVGPFKVGDLVRLKSPAEQLQPHQRYDIGGKLKKGMVDHPDQLYRVIRVVTEPGYGYWNHYVKVKGLQDGEVYKESYANRFVSAKATDKSAVTDETLDLVKVRQGGSVSCDDSPAEKSEEPATEIVEEPNELALASARFAKSGPCVGDQYEIVPRQGFSLLKSRGTITEVLPNGMVGLEVTNHLGVTKQEYVHRVELTTQMTQGRIALTKSGGSADDENVTGKMCAKCGEHPVSTDLPLSGYCDECLTVPRHWW